MPVEAQKWKYNNNDVKIKSISIDWIKIKFVQNLTKRRGKEYWGKGKYGHFLRTIPMECTKSVLFILVFLKKKYF